MLQEIQGWVGGKDREEWVVGLNPPDNKNKQLTFANKKNVVLHVSSSFPPFILGIVLHVEDPTLSNDMTKIVYISVGNSHLIR